MPISCNDGNIATYMAQPKKRKKKSCAKDFFGKDAGWKISSRKSVYQNPSYSNMRTIRKTDFSFLSTVKKEMGK